MKTDSFDRVKPKPKPPQSSSGTLTLVRRFQLALMNKPKLEEPAEEQVIVLARQLLQHATDPVVACDVKGRILLSNPAADELYSSEGRSLVGQLMSPALTASLQSESEAGERGVLLAAADRPRSDRLLQAKGRSDHVTFVPVQLGNPGEAINDVTFFWGHVKNRDAEICADQTEQEAKSERKSAHQDQNHYLATVCHEIRTPLNGLFGMLDLLSKTELVGDQLELLETARMSARQLRGLLNDVLDMAKIEAGKLEFESVPFDVLEQLSRVVRVFRASAELKGLTLSFKHSTPHRMLMGDVFRISQVLNNLIDNALKFTESGFIVVGVRTEQPDRDQALCNLLVTVEDSGCGISPDQMPDLFHPFAQADNSVSRTFGGTGLGLSLCRELCEAMGGHISAAPRPGGGAIFTFMVRCELAYGMSPFVDTRPMDEAQFSALQGASVLVVDDNRVNQTLLARWLKSAGMTVTQLFDGKSAVEAVRSRPFDLVLMDISMPEMSGIEAARAIRALASSDGGNAKRFSKIPILGMSGYAMLEDRDACLAAGMCGYVSKPLKLSELLEQMLQAVSRAELAPLQ